MKKWIWSLLLFWPLKLFAATFGNLGEFRNSTGKYNDTVYVPGCVSDSLLLRGTNLDSIRYVRYRGKTFVDSTKATFLTDTLKLGGSFLETGCFMRAFRASDASGHLGQYIVHTKIYSHDQTSANFEENYIYTYMVLSDPKDEEDTADIAFAKGSNGGTIVTGADDRVILSNSALHGGAAFLLTGDRLAFTSTSGAAWSITGTGAGAGVSITGGNTGNGLTIASGTAANVSGIAATGGGSGAGISGTGGTTGNGMILIGGGTRGAAESLATTAGAGLAAIGGGANPGIQSAGGATGNGITVAAGASAGTQQGVSITGGPSGVGLFVKGGSTTGSAESTAVTLGYSRNTNTTSNGATMNVTIPNVTTVTGNVNGSVGSVTGAVGSVTGNVGGNVVGSVGSVTGAVGSVTGNVGGNVVGSVGSVTGAVGSVTAEVRINSIDTLGVVLVARKLNDTTQTAIFDTNGMAVNLDNNLIHEPGFEGMATGALQAAGRYWWDDQFGSNGTMEVVYRPSGQGGTGRKYLRIKNGVGIQKELISDSFYLPKGQRVIFGADFLGSSIPTNLVGGTVAIGAGPVVTVTIPVANKWVRVYGYWKETVGATRWFECFPDANTNDSLLVDNAFVYVIPDSVTPGNAAGSTDTNIIKTMMLNNRFARHRSAPGNPLDTVNAVTSAVGVTVTFSAGTGANTIVFTTKDSANAFVVVDGVVYEVRDSTSQNVQARYPSDQSGRTSFSLNNGTYYVKRFKPTFRPIYGSSPSPQDSIYLRVTGNASRTDTIVASTFTSPSPTGRTRVYGFIRDLTQDSLVNFSVTVKLSVPTGQITRCCTDSTSPVIQSPVEKGVNVGWPGYWYIDVTPSDKYHPDTQYEFTFNIEGMGVFSKVVTVPDQSEWLFKFGP